MRAELVMRRYHSVVWDEPTIFEMGHKGARGFLLPRVSEKVKGVVGNVMSRIPVNMRRKQPPSLPEVSEPEVMGHYLRLSQQTFGYDSGLQIGRGTSTVKYSPKINELLARLPQMTDIHPLQGEETVQGILEVMYRVSKLFCEIAGMDEFTLQPASGCHGEFTMACIIKAYHRLNGELGQRTEMLVPIKSHSGNAAAAATAGFKVVSLYPDDNGCTPVEAVKAAVTKHTAGMMMTNPQEYSIFDSNIQEHVETVHEVGGIMGYDMANFNGLLGVTRAGDMGFDLCHFNVHKTFSSPHGSGGPACAPVGVKEELRKFLPVPVVEFDVNRYYLNYDKPHSIGKTRGFYGNVANALRAYAWIMILGYRGLREVAEIAVINANYLTKKLAEVPGINVLMGELHHRLGQAEFSLDKLKEDTGIGLREVNMRLLDHGIESCETGHHPFINTRNPCALEPTETIPKYDLDRYIEVFHKISHESYTDPEVVKTAPHNCALSKIDHTPRSDPDKWASSWRLHLKKLV